MALSTVRNSSSSATRSADELRAGGLARREFLAYAAAAASLPWAARSFAAEVPKKPQPGAPKESDIHFPPGATMPTRLLGRTGVSVSLMGLGGFHLSLPESEQTAVRIVRMAIDHGVSFMDNCWDYANGESQRRMGRALRDGYRDKVFLMTKIDGRTRKAAEQQIDQCLRDLQTDTIDLLQIHEVIRMTDPERVFAQDGAMEALLAARKAGKIRFIGFTGHKSADIHLAMLKAASANGFTFDTVQMPLNVMDGHEDGFEKKVLPVLVERDIGVLGMKPFGSGLFLTSRPFKSRSVAPADCLHYAMSLPTSVVITGCDTVGVLKQGIDAAYRWKPRDEAWRRKLLAQTASAADDGLEKYKDTVMFDGTTQHPWWLDTASVGG